MGNTFAFCILVLCIGAILAAGCTAGQNVPGGGSSASTTADPSSSGSGSAKEVTIRIKDSSFDPPAITIPAGTTVVWINEDTLAHRVTSTGTGTVRLDSSSLAPGQSYRKTFSQPGKFEYADNQHSFMTGTITVV